MIRRCHDRGYRLPPVVWEKLRCGRKGLGGAFAWADQDRDGDRERRAEGADAQLGEAPGPGERGRFRRGVETVGAEAAVLTSFSIGMTGRTAPAVTPHLYVAVVAAAGLLALAATALPGRVALRVRAVTVATAQE